MGVEKFSLGRAILLLLPREKLFPAAACCGDDTSLQENNALYHPGYWAV